MCLNLFSVKINMPKIILPPKEKIIKTSNDDSGPERYYADSSFIRKIYLGRLQIAIDLAADKHYYRLLEIGYGNGMLFPTFANMAFDLYGIDIHGREKAVANFFPGKFIHGSIYSIPLEDNSIDCIFCLSVLEHLDNLEQAAAEIKRVAKDQADIIFGIPSDNIFMKTFFWLKKSPAIHTHINSKKKLIKFINNNFETINKKKLNIFGINCYTAIKCHKPL
jgi:ubiquinone/menaquinone biosynthesis C-methylase UbiE